VSVLDPDAGVTTLRRPSPREAQRLVEDATEAGALLTLFGTCTVDYEGRAASRLESGDRHVMLKPDGTALVHTDEGHQPVNWQPPGCTHEAYVDDGHLVVRSERSKPAELLVIRFSTLRQAAAFDVRDPAELALVGTHDDLRDRLLEEPDLVEPGFVPVETERRTSAGAIDVLGEDAEGRPVVVEVKRSRVGPEAVGQLRRYVDALEREFEAGADEGSGAADETEEGDPGLAFEGPVRGFLVAPSVTDPALALLESDGYEFVALSPDPDATGD
jgi:RecB family endonuclease NucS